MGDIILNYDKLEWFKTEEVSYKEVPTDQKTEANLRPANMLRYSTQLLPMSSRKPPKKPIKTFFGTLLSEITQGSIQASCSKQNFKPYIFSTELTANQTTEEVKQVTAFGRYIAQYLSHYLQTGLSDRTILENGFNLEEWNKKNKKTKLTLDEKNEKIEKFIDVTHKHLHTYCDQDLEKLYHENKSNFFELKKHLLALQKRGQQTDRVTPLLREIVKILYRKMATFDIHELKPELQKDVIKDCFKNEDRVWRDRGGRPEDTFDDFL